jgi:hypothetical protein
MDVARKVSAWNIYAVFCITEIIFLKYGAKVRWIFQAAVEGATQTAATGDANCGHRPFDEKNLFFICFPALNFIRESVITDRNMKIKQRGCTKACRQGNKKNDSAREYKNKEIKICTGKPVNRHVNPLAWTQAGTESLRRSIAATRYRISIDVLTCSCTATGKYYCTGKWEQTSGSLHRH